MSNNIYAPWNLDEEGDIEGADGRAIALVYEECCTSILLAAPELVEVLREARSGLIAHTGGEHGACAETIKRIDAALSKAAAPEGE